MRRRVRLTGRRQLRKSAVSVKFADLPGKRLLTMAVADKQTFRDFPPDAKLTIRLQENKRIEVLDFGTVAAPKSAEVTHGGFDAPTCQLRITSIGPDRRSLLLGSTDGWTIHGDDSDAQEGRKSLLLFMPAETAPRSWKLDIRDTDYPIVYVDKRIPDARNWARSDPLFQAAVLPAILSQIFDFILGHSALADVEWAKHWLKWAEGLMPGTAAPFTSDVRDRRDYIDALLDTFCMRHELADSLLKFLAQSKGVP